MSSSFFRGFVLLGFLCLWVTPTEELGIRQDPEVALSGRNASLIPTDVDSQNVYFYLWYQSDTPDPSKFILGYIKNSDKIIKDLDIDATIDKNGTLTILKVDRLRHVRHYTLQVLEGDKVKTATTILHSSTSSVIYSSFLLLATALFSSQRLL